MADKPIFPDCVFPEGCECAGRGYEHERHSCAVPSVARAAMNLRPGVPTAVITPFGTVQPLRKSDDIAADVLAALDDLTIDELFDRGELARLLENDTIARALQAEAGVGSSPTTVLQSCYERLRGGATLKRWLVLAPTPAGDAVFWNVAIDHLTPRACATHAEMEQMCELLRAAGGGTVRTDGPHRADVPTEEQLKALRG